MSETQVIGRYNIVSELGRGGMGVVFKAWEESLQRFVAIKMLGDQLTQDETVVNRFLREARAVADLNHPNVVQVFAVDTHEGRPYFAMEYVEGDSLTDLIHTSKRIEPKRAAQIIKEAANGLAAAHAKDVIHRDIKPDNIMLTKHGGVKVVDFGIAKVDDPDSKLTATGMMVGTPNYISPEVCLGQEVDGASDIFSLGIVFFEMLAGSTPFQADSPIAMMTAVVQAEVPDITTLNPEVDKSLRAVLSHMLQKDRQNRYNNCNEIIEDLEEFLAGKPPTHALTSGDVATVAVPRPDLNTNAANPTPAAASPATKGQANQGLRWGLVVALLLVVGTATGSWFYMGSGPGDISDADIPDAAPVEPNSTLTQQDGESIEQDPTATDNLPEAQQIGQQEDPSLTQAHSPTDNSPAKDPNLNEGIASIPTQGQPQISVEQPEVDFIASQPETRIPPTNQAATASEPIGPPKLVVIARGDPNVALSIESALENALLDAEYDVLDEQFFGGYNSRDTRFDLAFVSQVVQDNGGDILVLASVRKTGERQLSFYGRTEFQTQANLRVQAVSLASKRNIGAAWQTALEYAPLNANDNAVEATNPIAAELVERLQALNN